MVSLETLSVRKLTQTHDDLHESCFLGIAYINFIYVNVYKYNLFIIDRNFEYIFIFDLIWLCKYL